MDSEISRIWEEALRYAAPLPVPATDTSTKTSNITPGTSETNNNKNYLGNTSTQPYIAADSQHSSHVDTNTNSFTNRYPQTLFMETAVESVSSTSNSLIEELYAYGTSKDADSFNTRHEKKAMNSTITTTSGDPSDSAFGREMPLEVLNKSSADLSKSVGSLTNYGLLNMHGLLMNPDEDISSELAAGLKMIQQGNELIAKALKLSNAKTGDVGSPLSYCSLEPISMPSSVESVSIPSDKSVEEADPRPLQDDATVHTTKRLYEEEQVTPFNSDNCSHDTNHSDPKVKRRRRREKNPDLVPSVPVLPPCRICDEKSSGFHYGANTCEACKGFFRRTLKKDEIAFPCKCTESEKEAWKRGPFKNGCPSCRYARCLTVGMSKSAIKIGRYTLNRKTENIKEVKSLEAIDSVIEKAIYSSVFQDSSPSSLDSSAFGSPDGLNMSVLSPLLDSPSPELSTSDCRPPPLTVKEMESIIAEVTAAHQTSQIANQDILDRPREMVNEIHRKFLEDYQLKESLFGDMKPLTKDEYKDFYNATGIDIDGRQASLKEALQHFTKKIVKFVEYAKTIPGFSDLSLKDQASLIKHSRPEHFVLASYRSMIKNMSSDLQVVTTPWGKEIHLKDIGKFIPKENLKIRLSIARQFQKMELSLEEEAIVRAIVITFSDRCELDDPEAVQQIQYKLIACLEHLFAVREHKSKNPIYKLFDILVQFREFSEKEFKFIKELVIDWPMIATNTLLRDFLL